MLKLRGLVGRGGGGGVGFGGLIIYLFIYLYIKGQNQWSTNNRTQGPLHRSTSKRPVDVTENRVGTTTEAYIYKDKTKIRREASLTIKCADRAGG